MSLVLLPFVIRCGKSDIKTDYRRHEQIERSCHSNKVFAVRAKHKQWEQQRRDKAGVSHAATVFPSVKLDLAAVGSGVLDSVVGYLLHLAARWRTSICVRF